MKRKICLIIFILSIICFLIWSCSGSGSKNQFPEQFGETIFNLIKTGDIEAYRSYLPTRNDYQQWLDQSTMSAELKEDRRKIIDRRQPEIAPKLLKGFSELRKQAAGNSIDWSETILSRIDFRLRDKVYFKSIFMEIYFFHKETQYFFEVRRAAWFPRGWLQVLDCRWRGKAYDSHAKPPKTPYTPQKNNLEPFAETIFSILKTNDREKLTQCILNKDDLIEKWSKETSNVPLKNVDPYLKGVHALVPQSFDELRKHAASEGIDWSKTRLTRVEYRTWVEYNTKRASITMIFSHGDYEYGIDVIRCPKLKRGWLLEEGISRQWLSKKKRK